MLRYGNSKIGHIYNFSLPAFKTCPGKTEFCSRFCYGVRGCYAQKHTINALENNFNQSQQPDFCNPLKREITSIKCKIIRIHVVGDFYSECYINQWINIAKEFPNKTFYAYTRSWRVQSLLEPLNRLRQLDNCFISASTDFTHPDLPDSSWRVVSINGDGIPCPHDSNENINCLDCKLCFTGNNNISFKVKHLSKSKNLSQLLI